MIRYPVLADTMILLAMICKWRMYNEQRRIFLEKAAWCLSGEIPNIEKDRDTADKIRKTAEDGTGDGLHDLCCPCGNFYPGFIDPSVLI